MFGSIAAISIGAALGALLRWWLGMGLNRLFSTIPPGTFAANAIGGYLIGVAVAFFATHPNVAPEWRLFIITGFLGGLTTFSTFSAEVVSLLQQGRLIWALTAIGAHVLGSLTMTLLGFATVAILQR